MYKCNFCSYEHIKPNSIIVHQKACRSNPNRIPGKNHYSYGAIISEETREKHRKNSSRKKHSEETKNKISKIRIKFLTENPDKVPYLLNHSSKGASYPELYWKNVLENNSIKFDSELQINKYRLDFVIGNIDLEIDGDQHYLDKRIVESDLRRKEFLNDLGYEIIRIRWSTYQKLSQEKRIEFVKNIISQLNGVVT